MVRVRFPRYFPVKTAFPRFRKPVTIHGWLNSSDSSTSTVTLASSPRPRSTVSSVTPERWSSLSSAAEKNDMRCLRPGLSQPLRQAAPTGPRPFRWRQTCLPRRPSAQGPVFMVRGREERTLGLAGRQPAVHQGLCLLRGPTLPPAQHPRNTLGSFWKLSRHRVHPARAPGPCSGRTPSTPAGSNIHPELPTAKWIAHRSQADHKRCNNLYSRILYILSNRSLSRFPS